MFSSGNTDKLTKPGRKMLGLDALRTASNEQGVPIPWFCGRARLGVTYISRMFGVVSTKVKAGGKGGQVSGYKYSAGFAALIGFGPLDTIYNVILSDDILWPPEGGIPVHRPGAGVNYVDLTIPNMGTLRVYWGTETQVADPGLVYDGIEHPAYQGYGYCRALSWNLGEFSGGDVPAPNLEILAGRYPEPDWWVLPSVKIGEDINPAAAIWDLLSPIRKNGIDPELIDTDSLIDVAAVLDDEEFGMSPIFTASKSIRECLIEICQTFDGWFRQSDEGLLTFGLNRPTAGILPEFDPEDMTKTPEIDTGSWTQTSSGAQVRFRNGLIYLNEDVASAFDGANFSVTGRTDAPSVDRLFITDPDLAQDVASAMAQRNGIPAGGGQLGLRKSRIGSLKPGDRFTFNYPNLGVTSLPAIARAIQWPEPGRPEVIVEYESDNTQTLSGDYVAPAYVPPSSAVKTPVASPLQFGFELLGAGAPDHELTYFAFSAVRPTLEHNGFYIWREFPAASSDYVDQVDQFASWTPELYLYGASVAMGATTFEVYLGPEAMLGGMLGIGDTGFGSFSSSDIDAGKVYLALDVGGFGDPVEIVLVTGLVPGGGTGRYSLTVVRGQWGTSDVAHDGWATIGVQSSCAMLNTDDLARVGVDAPFDAEFFLLQPAIAGRRADITTLVPIEIDRSLSATPPPANLRAFDDRLNPFYTTGQAIPIAWDATIFDEERPDLAARTSTELEIWDAPNTTLKTTIVVAETIQTYTWANAALVTALGSETNFHIRAYQKLDGVRSSTYGHVLVRKV